jgi:hypothetical protein
MSRQAVSTMLESFSSGVAQEEHSCHQRQYGDATHSTVITYLFAEITYNL